MGLHMFLLHFGVFFFIEDHVYTFLPLLIHLLFGIYRQKDFLILTGPIWKIILVLKTSSFSIQVQP